MKVEHLIVDTNAFVKNVPLHELGENIYATREVVAEIKDSATRLRVQSLPYDIQYREPHSEYIQLVTKLSKATGDYSSLSAVDIQLIALAYQITKEQLGPDASAHQLKTELSPDDLKKQTVMGGNNNNKNAPETTEQVEEEKTEDELVEEVSDDSEEDNVEEDDEEDIVEEEDEDDDEEGWITPSNYRQKIKEMQAEGGEFQDPDEATKAACLTNDFSMQNLMLHIGIKVLSSNGMLIKQLRTYILRCYTCFQTTSKMEKLFCPKCGHKTLKRVSVTVNPDGTQVIHLSRRVNLTGKGKKFPLPKPKGGKHAVNPILVEDQPIAQQRPSKQALKRNNPLEGDYIAGNSPFVTKDLYSRAAILGINGCGVKHYWDKRNPNEPRKANGKKKRNTKA